jgi:hypothetical protein
MDGADALDPLARPDGRGSFGISGRASARRNEMTMSKRSAFHVCVIGLGIAALWVSVQAQQRQALSVEKVTANLWVIVGNGGNVAVMPTNDGVLLVDDKFAEDAPEIVAKVKTPHG